jgi:hypothetical protein
VEDVPHALLYDEAEVEAPLERLVFLHLPLTTGALGESKSLVVLLELHHCHGVLCLLYLIDIAMFFSVDSSTMNVTCRARHVPAGQHHRDEHAV